MSFKIESISSERQKSMEKTGAWSSSAPVGIEKLRSVFVSYIDFEGILKHDGEIIVLESVAQATLNIFRELLKCNFPLHSVRPIDEYDADDDISVLENNTSAYCFRPIEGSSVISVHSYGVAIDVNPYFNPYIAPVRNPGGMVEIADYKMDYLQRFPSKRGMVEPIVDVFIKNGFTIWGGRWSWPIDYHHFQTTRTQAKLLAELPSEVAGQFFAKCVEYPALVQALERREKEVPGRLIHQLIKDAQSSSEEFFRALDVLLALADRV